MALAINEVTLVGHLTKDPELHQLPNGGDVCEMRIAVSGMRNQPPLYIDIAQFGAAARPCKEFLRRGRSVGVHGRLVYREWTAKDGSTRSKHSVIGRVQFGPRQRSAEDIAADEAVAAVRETFPDAEEIPGDEEIPF